MASHQAGSSKQACLFQASDLKNTPTLLDFSLITRASDYAYIYRPCDDSYLMLDTLYRDIHTIESACSTILEIGVGSGFVSNNLKAMLDARDWAGSVLATDVNI